MGNDHSSISAWAPRCHRSRLDAVSPTVARLTQSQGPAGRGARGDILLARPSPGSYRGPRGGRASFRRAAGHGGGLGWGGRRSLCAGPRAGTSGHSWRAPSGARLAGRCRAAGPRGGGERRAAPSPVTAAGPVPSLTTRPGSASRGRALTRILERSGQPRGARSRRQTRSGSEVIQGARGPCIFSRGAESPPHPQSACQQGAVLCSDSGKISPLRKHCLSIIN